MKKIIIFAVVAAFCLYACSEAMHKKTITGNRYFCYNDSTDAACSTLPDSVLESISLGYATDSTTANDSAKQTPLDLFSWQTFIALNWPADQNGNPTGDIFTDNTSPRVWEHYTDPKEVFNNDGGTLILHLSMAKKSSKKFFYMFSKSPHDPLTNAGKITGFREADGNPLIDRNSNFTLYEIKLNSVEDTFITNNKLVTDSGIYNYAVKNKTSTLVFPSSITGSSPGTIEIKASWRILTNADDTSRYFCRDAEIYIDSEHTVNHKTLIVPHVKVGLVGMHIIRNTPILNQQLIWSSFEHIDNAPDSGATIDTSVRWSYYNPHCTNCAVNTPPPYVIDKNKFIWDTVQPYAGLYKSAMNGSGSQVMRVNKIPGNTAQVNRKWQEKMKKSVWANYKLVGTQWQFGNPGDNVGSAVSAPPLMANTTLETYLQHSASCIGCHAGAEITYTPPLLKPVPGALKPTAVDTITTGFSFVLAFGAHK